MIFGGRLLRRLDAMPDDALAGRFDAQDYDESMLSKIEAKTARFLDASRLRWEGLTAPRRARWRSVARRYFP
jgi:hypothetical protein